MAIVLKDGTEIKNYNEFLDKYAIKEGTVKRIKEHIEELEMLKAAIEWEYLINYQVVLDDVIMWIKQMIPKEVEQVGSGWFGTEYCPCCGIEVMSGNYCSVCGTALNWDNLE